MSQDSIQIIEDSSLFDAEWYRRTYSDIRYYDRSPAHHYAVYGAQVGRDPGPGFSSKGYLACNPEVAEAGHNPLWHYELFGKHEGKEPSPSVLANSSSPDPVRHSEIDRNLPVPLAGPARDTLSGILETRLHSRPHRFLTEFDHDTAARFIACLCAQKDLELTARGILVSVIMPSYNRANTLGRAIRSVLGQSHHNLELIVVDDGSTDYTADVVQRYRNDPRLTYCATSRAGVSAARNHGLSRAKGAVIFYLDSDNQWTRDFLRLMLMALELSGARSAYAASRLHNRAGDIAGYRGEPFDWAYCVAGNYVDLNVFCHRRELMDEMGIFDETLQRMVDWDLVLRYTRKDRPVYCPFIGCLYSDDPLDQTRISTSKPYIFERVVSCKNAHGFDNLNETLTDLRFSFAFKLPQGAINAAASELAQELIDRGHRVTLDEPEGWQARHPHIDEVVLILPGADDYVRHPEQVNIRLGDHSENAQQSLIPLGSEAANAVLEHVMAYLKGTEA